MFEFIRPSSCRICIVGIEECTIILTECSIICCRRKKPSVITSAPARRIGRLDIRSKQSDIEEDNRRHALLFAHLNYSTDENARIQFMADAYRAREKNEVTTDFFEEISTDIDFALGNGKQIFSF